MKVARVTRDVEPSALRRLLDDSPRATVAFVERGAAELLPVTACSRAGVHLFGVTAGDGPPLEGREVLLVRDGGAYWFELCGVSVRGVAKQVEQPGGDAGERLRWYAVLPGRVLAWDYATIREE